MLRFCGSFEEFEERICLKNLEYSEFRNDIIKWKFKNLKVKKIWISHNLIKNILLTFLRKF